MFKKKKEHNPLEVLDLIDVDDNSTYNLIITVDQKLNVTRVIIDKEFDEILRAYPDQTFTIDNESFTATLRGKKK